MRLVERKLWSRQYVNPTATPWERGENDDHGQQFRVEPTN